MPPAGWTTVALVRVAGFEPALFAISGRRLLPLGYTRGAGGRCADRTCAPLRAHSWTMRASNALHCHSANRPSAEETWRMVMGSNHRGLAAGIALATRPLTTRATIRILTPIRSTAGPCGPGPRYRLESSGRAGSCSFSGRVGGSGRSRTCKTLRYARFSGPAPSPMGFALPCWVSASLVPRAGFEPATSAF